MKLAAAFAAALLAAVLAGRVLAHAELLSAEPEPGATVAGPLSVLTLTFSEAVTAGSDAWVITAAFQTIRGVEVNVSGTVLTATFAQPLPPGTYTVQWIAISLDGHPISGSYQIGIGQPAHSAPDWLWLVAGAALVGAAALHVIRRRASAFRSAPRVL